MSWINKFPINLPMVAKAVRLAMLPVLCGWIVWQFLELGNIRPLFAVVAAIMIAGLVGRYFYKRDFQTPP